MLYSCELLIPIQEQDVDSSAGGEHPGGVLKPKSQEAESLVSFTYVS